MAREYFAAYHSYLKSIEPLNDAERGRLFTACLSYSATGAEPDLHGNERFVWPTIREQIDRDANNYRAMCERNKKNVLRRYTTVYDRLREPTTAYQNYQGKGEGEGEGEGKGEGDKISSCPDTAAAEPDRPPKRKGRVYGPDDKPYRAARHLAKKIHENIPSAKPTTEKQLQEWSNHFRLLHEQDGYDWNVIADVLDYSQEDEFWKKNILSGGTFRRQFLKLLAKAGVGNE